MVRRRRWIQRSLLALAALLVGAAALSYWAYKGTPDYYRHSQLTPEQRADAAGRAERKLIRTQNWANDLWVSEQRAIVAGPGATSGPASAPRPVAPFTISFTEDELNASLEKWSHHRDWGARAAKYLRDPAIVLRDDRLIVAGTVPQLGAVGSFHFAPQIDEQGQLRLALEGVRAGRLPMPDIVWAAQRDRIVAGLHRRLAGWQREATIAANGAANGSAVAAHMSKLLFDVLARRPREPVLFLPVFQDHADAIPVRITAVDVARGALSLTVEPMTPAERAALLDRIREPVPGATASVQ